MKIKLKKIGSILAILFLLTATSPALLAQCPMCKLSAESNLKDGGQAGKGLNAGILYMFATPYLLVAGLTYVWWHSNKQRGEEDEEPFVGIE